jgi:hypothetical protein
MELNNCDIVFYRRKGILFSILRLVKLTSFDKAAIHVLFNGKSHLIQYKRGEITIEVMSELDRLGIKSIMSPHITEDLYYTAFDQVGFKGVNFIHFLSFWLLDREVDCINVFYDECSKICHERIIK